MYKEYHIKNYENKKKNCDKTEKIKLLIKKLLQKK